MITVFVGVGGNLGDSLETFNSVINDLAHSSELTLQRVSSFYKTKPLDDPEQPEYLNAVLQLATNLSPHALLDLLQSLELKYGRVRTEKRWASRTLDLDVLLYGEQIIHDERLDVPHKEMQNRDFVLFPLYEISPELDIPGLGKLEMLKSTCENRGMIKL